MSESVGVSDSEGPYEQSLRCHMRWACGGGTLANAWTRAEWPASAAIRITCMVCKGNIGLGTELMEHAKTHINKEFTQESVDALASVLALDPDHDIVDPIDVASAFFGVGGPRYPSSKPAQRQQKGSRKPAKTR